MTTVQWFDEVDASIEDHEHQRAEHLFTTTAAIEQRQGNWYQLNRWNAILLTNRDLPGFAWGCDYVSDMGPVDLRSENLVESIGESMVSKAASSPLKPTPVPRGRSFKMERAVRVVDQFQFGVWRKAKAEEAAIQSFLDAYTSGIGCVRVGFEGRGKSGTLKNESVFFDNLVIDDRECANRTLPRTYRIRQVVPRSGIEALYGKSLDPRKKRYHDERDVGEGYEVLIEAWRLPGPDGKGGRHVVASCGQLLVDEEWKHSWVPLAFFHWQDPISGFHPKSGVEQLVPYQIRQNELNDAYTASLDIASRARLLIHANSSIDVSQWDNEAGRMLMYAGVKPEPFVWDVDLQNIAMERERNRAAAFSYVGLSEMFGQADVPDQVRMDSSAGIREVANLEDRRHLRRWSRFQEFRLQIARLNMLVLSTTKGADAYSVVYHPGGNRASARTKEIEYRAIKTLTEDDYSWDFEATPMSAFSPAARRELVRDWESRHGTTGQGQRMIGVPNLEMLEELELASYDDILRHLDLLEDGEMEEPTEVTNLTYGIPKVKSNLHRLKNYDDVPPEVIENHYAWIQTALSIQQAAVAGAQMPGPLTPFQPTQGMSGTSAAQAPAPRTLIQTTNYGA